MILEIILVLIVFLLVNILFMRTNKKKYKLYDEIVEDMGEMIYDDNILFTPSFKNILLDYIKANPDSRNNFLECIKDIYFNNIYRKKKTYKNLVSSMSIDNLKSIPDTKFEIFVDLEKYFIGLGLFAHYNFNLDNKNIESYETFEELYKSYINTLEYSPFSKYVIGSKCVMSHFKGIYKTKTLNNDKIKYILNILCSGRNNLYAFSLWYNCNIAYFNRDERDDSYLEELFKVKNINELKEYKKFYSEFLRKETNSFDSILEDDNCLPVSHFIDLELFDGFYMKVLMYFNLEKQKIEFKEFVKEKEDQSYHTVNKYSSYPLLLIFEYILFFESYIYDILFAEKYKEVSKCQ